MDNVPVIMPLFWVSNHGIEDGMWTIFVKVIAKNKVHEIGGTFPLDKVDVKLHIYEQQIKALNTAAVDFFKKITSEYMNSAEYLSHSQFKALPKPE